MYFLIASWLFVPANVVATPACLARFPHDCRGTLTDLVERETFAGLDMTGNPALVDWDQDGDLDVVVGFNDGTLYYGERLGVNELVVRREADNPFRGMTESSDSVRKMFPAVVDWDGDGDLDLVVGTLGKLHYFERVAMDTLEERIGEGVNPFDWYDTVANYAVPAFADWDEDGDLDLVVSAAGRLRYFERVAVDIVEERIGEGQNPFHLVNGKGLAGVYPAFVDWDRDGDLDLVLGVAWGELMFFERVADDMLEQRTGHGRNPFHGIQMYYYSNPAFADWDQDGGMDLIIRRRIRTSSDSWFVHFERLRVNSWMEPERFSEVEMSFRYSPAPVDWDLDGDMDLVVGDGFLGNSLMYYEQVAGSLVPRTGEDNPFHALAVDGIFHAPVFVDWDEDGDLDLVIGTKWPPMQYFERVNLKTLEKRTGEHNPFHKIGAAHTFLVPTFVDWDHDGDPDMVVGEESGGLLYFERLDDGTLAARTGEGLNPFHGLGGHPYPWPAFLDSDEDGDQDLVLASVVENGLRYFEQVAKDSLTERVGAQNPFHGDEFLLVDTPVFVDWNQDGAVDLLAGTKEELLYFKRGSCRQIRPCGGNGLCSTDGRCLCMPGYREPACTSCKRDHFTVWEGTPPTRVCTVCSSTWQGVCSTRGICMDDAAAKLPLLSSPSLSMQAIGNGSCVCSEPSFLGESCEDGHCPAGTEEVLVRAGKPNTCRACFPGFYSNPGQACEACPSGKFAPRSSGSCDECPPGSVPTEGQGDCIRCGSGRFASVGDAVCTACPRGRFAGFFLEGSSSCDVCPLGRVPTESQGDCIECPGGHFAEAGDAICTACSQGRFALAGSRTCSTCVNGSVPTEERSDCLQCPAGSFTTEGRVCQPCPEGQFSAPGSSTCLACPVGKIPLEGGLGPCTSCVAGTFAGEQSTSCEPCPPRHISSMGSSACEKCSDGWYPDSGRTVCFLDFTLLANLIAICCLQFAGWCPLFFNLRQSHRVADVRSTEGGLLITLDFGSTVPAGRHVEIEVTETGSALMPLQWIRATVLDFYRMQITDVTGVESSRGSVKMRFPQELLRTKSFSTLCPATNLVVCVVMAGAWTKLLIQLRAQEEDVGVLIGRACFAHAQGIVCALFAALCRRAFRQRSKTRLEQRIIQYRAELLAGHPNPRRTERGPYRAVTVGKLHALWRFFEDFICDRNAYYLNENITNALTKNSQLSPSELMGPALVDYFVSHFWGTSFRDFVLAIRNHAQQAFTQHQHSVVHAAEWQSIAYWVCFLSNNQWEISEELGNGQWQQSSFYLAMHSRFCQGTCMVLDRHALPLKRSWCLFEVLQTYKLTRSQEQGRRFQGLVFCTTEGLLGEPDTFDTTIALATNLSTLSVRDATASNPKDQQMIIDLVAEEEASLGTTMDVFIKGNMKATLEMAQARFEEKALKLAGVLSSSQRGSESSRGQSVGRATDFIVQRLRRGDELNDDPEVALIGRRCESKDGFVAIECEPSVEKNEPDVAATPSQQAHVVLINVHDVKLQEEPAKVSPPWADVARIMKETDSTKARRKMRQLASEVSMNSGSNRCRTISSQSNEVSSASTGQRDIRTCASSSQASDRSSTGPNGVRRTRASSSQASNGSSTGPNGLRRSLSLPAEPVSPVSTFGADATEDPPDEARRKKKVVKRRVKASRRTRTTSEEG